MLLIVVSLFVVLVIAALVTAYVAFPHRGETIPHASWLSDIMTRSDQAVTATLTRLDERVDPRRDHRSRR